ncbi:hypothetical protein SAMN05421823_103752 [Catalinimonas alkaloidigena]|uniref:Uncharacterized protein n=1 Tax=Catalinimonas alkaloidigena TaxID=1075417 RepID=A0A1G9FE83_9BACT|nr:hypothetical protein [Catalinimonas alkaloidigena]SDK86667.1 hypothetical protein SAMN05421823_103752 [Catalinimonas alkaloidigena]
MDALSVILQGLVFISVMMLIIGLIRPGFAVWWGAEKSRASVLKVWGVIALISTVAYFFMSAQRDDPFKRDDAGAPTSMVTYPATEVIG